MYFKLCCIINQDGGERPLILFSLHVLIVVNLQTLTVVFN